MDNRNIIFSVVYKDNFSEEYEIDEQELEVILKEAENEESPHFHIGKKVFFKHEVALIATESCSIQFI